MWVSCLSVLFFLVCWVALGCVPMLVLKSLCLLVEADSDSRLNGEEAVSLAWLRGLLAYVRRSGRGLWWLSRMLLSPAPISTPTCSMGQRTRLLGTSKALMGHLLHWVLIPLSALVQVSFLLLVTSDSEFVKPPAPSYFWGGSLLHILHVFFSLCWFGSYCFIFLGIL